MPSTTTPSPAITAAAAHLAAAEQDAAEAGQISARAEAQVNVLRQRIATADGAKAAIAARRNAGDHRNADAGELALLALDREGLVALLSEAEAAVAPLHVARNQAQRMLSLAAERMQNAKNADELAALVLHADTLAGLLEQALGGVRTIETRTMRSGTWKPSREFYETIRRGAAMSGML